MAWSFRRRIKIGPININLSKSGIGYSAGVPGFRVGKDAKDRPYQQVSIPGTGLYNRTYGTGGKKSWRTNTIAKVGVLIAGIIAGIRLILRFIK